MQLIAWNPTIHVNCDNLDSMVGRSICVSPPGSKTYTASTRNITLGSMSSMFTGPYSTGSINLNPPSITTTWYNNQTTFQNPSITTVVANLTASSIVATRTSLCPISPTDFLDDFDIGSLPDACASLIQPYCFPNPDSPSPISTRFPAVCTPKKATATSATTTSPSTAKPSPLTPDTIASCKQYYKILDGDNCYSVANNFKVTLTQFYTWNPYVGTDCGKLYLGYYVCILA